MRRKREIRNKERKRKTYREKIKKKWQKIIESQLYKKKLTNAVIANTKDYQKNNNKTERKVKRIERIAWRRKRANERKWND